MLEVAPLLGSRRLSVARTAPISLHKENMINIDGLVLVVQGLLAILILTPFVKD